MKKCPYCAEEIQNEAIICKHCRSDLTIPIKIKGQSGSKNDNIISTQVSYEWIYDQIVQFLNANPITIYVMIFVSILALVIDFLVVFLSIIDKGFPFDLILLLNIILYMTFAVTSVRRKEPPTWITINTTFFLFWTMAMLNYFNIIYTDPIWRANKNFDNTIVNISCFFLPMLIVMVAIRWNKIGNAFRNLLIGVFIIVIAIIFADFYDVVKHYETLWLCFQSIPSYSSKILMRIAILIMIFLSVGTLIKKVKSNA